MVPNDSDEAAKPETAAVIERDFACICCGYNLRGLRLDGRCPECGGPAAQELRYADREWLQRALSGLRRIQLALLGGVFVVLLWLVVVAFAVRVVLDLLGNEPSRWFAPASALFGICVSLSIAVLLVSGVFAVTTPDPLLEGAESPSSWRRRARVVCTTICFLIVVRFGVDLLLPRMAPSSVSYVYVAAELGGLVLFLYLLFALFRHLNLLAYRLPEPALLQRSSKYGKMVAGVGGVSVLACAAALTLRDPLLAGIAGLVMYLAPLVLVLQGSNLIAAYNKAVSDVLSPRTDDDGPSEGD